MPAIGIDPRTGQLIVIPGDSDGTGAWGPDRSARDDAWREETRERTREEWERQERNRLARSYRRDDLDRLIEVIVFGNPYMAQAVYESGVNLRFLVRSPALFSSVAQLAFLKYQEDVKRAWQEGKGPLRPLTAKEFLEDVLRLPAGVYEPRYANAISQWDLTARRFFPWATDDAWWLEDPDYLAYNPAAKMGYGKVSEAPPGFEEVGEGVYRDPETGFLYFARTGAYLGHGFLDYYQQNADTLGDPVTNEFSVDGKTYQVFRGGVLSWDPETGQVSYHKDIEEAGLSGEQVQDHMASPSYWDSSGREMGSEVSLGRGTWTVDPYIGSGSDWYDRNPARYVLPSEAPSSYSYAGYSSIEVGPGGVWVSGPGGSFRQPDPWMASMFTSAVRSDPNIWNWYRSLGDREKNQVFANYLATGQIYL